MRQLRIALPLALMLLLWAPEARATTLVPVGEFDRPVFVTSDPSDPERLLVVEREGRVLVREGGSFTPFGDLASLVSCCEGERGLLSIAPAPDFEVSSRFYAAYTGTPAAGGAEGDIHLDAFRPIPAGEGQLIREPILSIAHSERANHNGGQLQFGPDGLLYLSTGDGGGAGDPFENGQSVDSRLGKVLRIEPRPGQAPSYVVPAGNPFVGKPGLDEIWSYGLRNPWRFSFDRLTGDLVIADVGQGLREEVDQAPSPSLGVSGGAGANYGWNCREGSIAYPDAPAACEGVSGFTEPVFDYPHADPGGGQAHGCSITGGYVVRDPSLPDLYGRYLYSDFCEGDLRSLVLPEAAAGRAVGDRSEGLAVAFPVSFGEDSCGRVYVVSNGGGVFRLRDDLGSECHAASVTPVVASKAPSAASESSPAAPSVLPRPVLHLRLRRGRAKTFFLTARLLPCVAAPGAIVQLNRGGRPSRRKPLNENCVARFRVRVLGRATFRAVFAGQRSQVRTIALAKPRP